MHVSSLFDSKGILTGLKLLHSGKVRDTYEIPSQFQGGIGEVRLVVASDRISVYDFVLPARVKDKGAILTAMNVFWWSHLRNVQQDIVASGSAIDLYLPDEMRGDIELQSRAVVVRTLEMIPVELIVRGYLTGSGWSAYQKTSPHMVCGHELPDGLIDGSKLPTPIFTPTTKAEVGHDEHMDFREVELLYGIQMRKIALSVYQQAQELAASRGIIIADTKFEMGMLGNQIVLGDERLTPDSSRFWGLTAYGEAHSKGKSPPSFDKQFVRDYARALGIDKLDPKNPEHQAQVAALEIDPAVLSRTTEIYHQAFECLVRSSLSRYQVESMGITRWKS